MTDAGQTQRATGRKIAFKRTPKVRNRTTAGLSFVAIHDGSAFEALQVVAPQELANYQSDVLRITSGCAVRATGELVASQGKGQAVELRADAPDEFRAMALRGEHPSQKEQIARPHRFRIDPERLRGNWQFNPKLLQSLLCAG